MAVKECHVGTEGSMAEIFRALNFSRYEGFPNQAARSTQEYDSRGIGRMVGEYFVAVASNEDFGRVLAELEQALDPWQRIRTMDLGQEGLEVKFFPAEDGVPEHSSCFISVDLGEAEAYWGYHVQGYLPHKGYAVAACVALLEIGNRGLESDFVLGVGYRPGDISLPIRFLTSQIVPEDVSIVEMGDQTYLKFKEDLDRLGPLRLAYQAGKGSKEKPNGKE